MSCLLKVLQNSVTKNRTTRTLYIYFKLDLKSDMVCFYGILNIMNSMANIYILPQLLNGKYSYIRHIKCNIHPEIRFKEIKIIPSNKLKLKHILDDNKQHLINTIILQHPLNDQLNSIAHPGYCRVLPHPSLYERLWLWFCVLNNGEVRLAVIPSVA